MNKIEIIGAGQLAMMLVQSAQKFGVDCVCYDPNENSPAFKYCKTKFNYAFDDQEKLQ